MSKALQLNGILLLVMKKVIKDGHWREWYLADIVIVPLR
mgnify:CR=1 FL=1